MKGLDSSAMGCLIDAVVVGHDPIAWLRGPSKFNPIPMMVRSIC